MFNIDFRYIDDFTFYCNIITYESIGIGRAMPVTPMKALCALQKEKSHTFSTSLFHTQHKNRVQFLGRLSEFFSNLSNAKEIDPIAAFALIAEMYQKSEMHKINEKIKDLSTVRYQSEEYEKKLDGFKPISKILVKIYFESKDIAEKTKIERREAPVLTNNAAAR